MKRMIAYTAGLVLAGAAFAQSYYSGEGPIEARGGYPPCSATITDRCIQLYEPGVATPTNLALNERLGDGNQMAAVEPVAPADDYAYAEYDNTAVGGPYEPIDEYYEADVHEPVASDYEGVGGPYEEAWANDYALGDWSPEQSYPAYEDDPYSYYY